jgi:hypothetical protein
MLMFFLSAALLFLASATAIAPVDLGDAGNFTILTKTGVTNVPNAAITGNIGVSPIVGASITGFALVASLCEDPTKSLPVLKISCSTSAQITGYVFASDYSPKTETMLTAAILAMEAAYDDAAGRITTSLGDTVEQVKFLNVGAGLIGGLTLKPGVYTWGTFVSIETDITISGSATELFIFQVGTFLNLATSVKVILQGGALASNIVWQVGTFVNAEVGTHLEGVLLVKQVAAFGAGASLNGRILAQEAATLGAITIITAP